MLTTTILMTLAASFLLGAVPRRVVRPAWARTGQRSRGLDL